MHRLIFCFLLGAVGLLSSSSDTSELLQKATEEMSRGDLELAEADIRLALAQSQTDHDQAQEFLADYDLYMLSEIRQRPNEAEKWLLAGLASCEKPDHKVEPTEAYLQLHAFYFRHSSWTSDVKTMKKLVNAYLPGSEDNARRLAVYSNILGDALEKTGDYASAELAYKFAISISDRFKINERNLNSLSDVLAKQGKKQEAKQVLKENALVVRGVINPQTKKAGPAIRTKLAKEAQISGTIFLTTNIDEAGVPKDIRVIVPLGFGLDESAVRAVADWRFWPATRDGVPYSTGAVIRLQFYAE